MRVESMQARPKAERCVGGAATAAAPGGAACISRDLEQAVEAQLPQLPEALGKRPRTADPAQRLQRSRERK